MESAPGRPFPAAPRVVAGGLAVAGGLTFGAAIPGGLVAQGYAYAAAAMAASTAPFVLLFALYALAPRVLEPAARRFTRLDLRDAGHAGAALVMACALFFILGYGAIVNGVYAYEHDVLLGREGDAVTGEALFTGLLLNAIVLILPVLLYVGFVSDGRPGNAFERLGLRGEGAGRAILVGCGAAIGALLLLALASLAIQGLEIEVPENELALEIARSVTVLGAFGIAIGAAVSEEVFFRGFLQPRIGLWGQAILFGLAHLSYVNVLEVVVTFILALLFGLLYRRTGNLWAPIAAHFLFNLLMLLAGIYAPEPEA